jgi:hypothetical protein
VLRLARDVAHGVERKVAPLASYLAGAAAGRASAGATGPDAAARRMEALGSIVATLGPSIPRVGDGPLSRSDPERGLDGPSDG